jgi:hypothetical protein
MIWHQNYLCCRVVLFYGHGVGRRHLLGCAPGFLEKMKTVVMMIYDI